MLRCDVQTISHSHSRAQRHYDALKHAGGTEAGFYNERVLDYLHFIFCLCLLERLLLTRKGRELFPVKTKGGGCSLVPRGHSQLFNIARLSCATLKS